jgi:hypothetical protein
MSRLVTIEMKIAGEYRDVWLYKSRLYLWDRPGTLSFVDLDVAAKYLTRRYGASIANTIQTLIFRNDWKVGEQFRAMMRVPEMERAFLLPFRHEDEDRVTVDLPTGLFVRGESEPYGGPVLDTGIYADRVYLATSEGLLESYINSRDPRRGYPLNQQTDFRVSRVVVRYAAINASAEDKGLFFARVRFAENGPGFLKSSWIKVADKSLATSHAYHNLLNYTGEAVPRFLTAKVEEDKTREAARYEENQVVGYQSEMDLSSLMYSAVASATKVTTKTQMPQRSLDDFEVLGNTNNHLLTVWQGNLRVIDIRSKDDNEVEAKPSLAYQKRPLDFIRPDDVLQTYPISGGFVAEMYDSLQLITRDGSFSLLGGPMARVRTFSSSLRHKEAIAAIHEDHASLVGFYMADDVLF